MTIKFTQLAGAAAILFTLSGCNGNGPDATQAEFDQVRMSMSYKDVVGLFGSEPDETADVKGAKLCRWDNEDKSMVIIVFQQDQVKNFNFIDPSKILGNR